MFAEKTMETGASSGTSALTLGTAVAGWKTWRSQFATATDVFYYAENLAGDIWEAGYGTLTYGGTDTITGRTLLLSSTGALVDFAGVTVYTQSIPNAAAMKHLLNPLAGTRPGWLRAGAGWLDTAAGLAVSWSDKIATTAVAGGDVEKGRLDVAKKIYIASNAAPIRDTTTAGSTIALTDRGSIVSHDTSAAVRVAALPAVATALEGFYFGVYADGIFPVFLDTNAGESIDNAVVPPGQIVWVRCTGAKWLTQGNANQALIGRRQTVTAGPLSSGAPSFLSTVSGLSITTGSIAAGVPLIVRAAQGDFERWGLTLANLTFGSLTNTATNYLYVTVGVDGVLTPLSTVLPPIYQESGTPATTAGQFTFNYGEMKGYLGNGSSAPAVYAVFIGEATCSGGNVSAVAAYAYNGRYEGAYVQNMPANVTLASANHNIGVVPKHVDFRAQITTTVGGWAVGEEFGFGSFFTNDGINPYSVPAIAADAKTVSTITSTGWTVCNKTTAAAQALSTQAKRRFIADRGW